jgi:succinate---hydroxymethylglutarate CoA-transferase
VLAPYQAYPTSDGHLNVGCANQKLWEELCDAIGQPELADNPQFNTNADRVNHMDELSETFQEQTTEEWVEYLADEKGLPVGPVFNVKNALKNEQTEARSVVQSLHHPAVGEIPVVEYPLNFDRAEAGFDEAPPLLGEDTRDVLAESGYSEESISSLRESGGVSE